MGVDTHLYLSSKWQLRDIKTVLERTQHKDVKIIACESFNIGCFQIYVGKREIFTITNSHSPLGSATWMSLHADDEAHQIFKDIANVLGGIIEYYDTDGKCEMFDGAISDENGIAYFVKYAILHDGVDIDDFKGFIQSVNKWFDETSGTKKPEDISKLLRLMEG